MQLSLTTYYFKDLNELLSLAFRSFMDHDYGEMTEQWRRAFRYLDQFSADDLAREETRQRIIDYCTKRVVDHIRHGLTEHPEGLAVEHHFFYEALNDPRLTELSALHRRRNRGRSGNLLPGSESTTFRSVAMRRRPSGSSRRSMCRPRTTAFGDDWRNRVSCRNSCAHLTIPFPPHCTRTR